MINKPGVWGENKREYDPRKTWVNDSFEGFILMLRYLFKVSLVDRSKHLTNHFKSEAEVFHIFVVS